MAPATNATATKIAAQVSAIATPFFQSSFHDANAPSARISHPNNAAICTTECSFTP